MSPLPSATRAELSFLRWAAEVGDPASVTAAACWGKPAAGMWSCGTADPSVPVAQEWSPGSQRHKEETGGEEIVVRDVLWCYKRLCMGKNLLIQYKSWGLQFNILCIRIVWYIARILFHPDGRGFAGCSSANFIKLCFSHAAIHRISLHLFLHLCPWNVTF